MSNFNATQGLGMAAFASAALANGLAALISRLHRTPMAAIAAFYALLTVEVWQSGRQVIGDVLRAYLRANNEYTLRRPIQALGILILATTFLFAIRSMRRRYVGKAGRAILTAFAAITLFALEVVSFHYVDAILYDQIGGVMVIGWCWLALATTAIVVAFAGD